jgi:serine/threonine protein kinase
LVEEFVDGIGMDKKVRSGFGQGGLAFDQVDAYARSILSIVRALHHNNILHRDISPHNLICTTDLRKDPVLLDFGTVKEGFNQLSVQVLSSQIVKAGYSAPELALGLASPASDLYSVGATMLFLYTNVNPQYLLNPRAEVDEQNKAIQRITHARREVLRKALSYHPADRYQTADDMLAALTGKAIGLTVAKPHIVASGRKYELNGPMIIGRSHDKCGPECASKGFSNSPDIPINDAKQFVSRHHAKVQLDRNGMCWIEDLRTPSHTAIKKASGYAFEELGPGRGYKLQDGDIIALAYSKTKGPYLTASYHTK